MTQNERVREAYGVDQAERRAMTERVIFNRPGKLQEELRWAEIGLRGLVKGQTAKFMSEDDKAKVNELLSSLTELRTFLQSRAGNEEGSP